MFESSIFDYTNSQICDPLFLTSRENQHVFEMGEILLYLISDNILLPKTVQIRESLIQDLAIIRLCRSHLILATLPYLKISFFTRLQTILFKVSPHEFEMLRPYDSAALSKKPMNYKLVRDWINNQPVLFQWIFGSSYKFAEIPSKGMFTSFVGFLFSELAFETTNDIIIRSNID